MTKGAREEVKGGLLTSATSWLLPVFPPSLLTLSLWILVELLHGFHRGFWRGFCCGFQADSGREFRRGFWRGFFLCIISKFFHQKETSGIHFKIHFEIHEEIHNKIHGAFSEIHGTLCRNSRDALQKFTGRLAEIHGTQYQNSRKVLQKFTGRFAEIHGSPFRNSKGFLCFVWKFIDFYCAA